MGPQALGMLCTVQCKDHPSQRPSKCRPGVDASAPSARVLLGLSSSLVLVRVGLMEDFGVYIRCRLQKVPATN